MRRIHKGISSILKLPNFNTYIMKYICLILIAAYLLSLTSHAQHFEWAASAGNIDIRYSFSSVDGSDNIVVGGPGGVNWSHRGKQPELYNSTGKITNLNYDERTDLIACYSPGGDILWHLQTDQRNTKLLGISRDENGSIVLLIDVKRTTGKDGKAYGYMPELNGSELMYAGYYLVFLNKEGRLDKKVFVFYKDPYKMDISGFVSTPNGGFLLCGFADPGKLCAELPVTAGPSGGDFVLVLDKDGHPVWADIVSYATTTCCTHSSEMTKVSVSNDGTVFLSGTFYKGGTFGGSKTIISKTSKEDTQYNLPYEAYIASYTSSGKFKWVSNSGSKWFSHSIAANTQGVVIAFKTMSGNMFLGEKVDTTNGKHWVLAMLDNSGNIKWKTTSGTDRAHEIRFDSNNDIYVLGTNREVGKWNLSEGIIGTDTLRSQFTTVFIAKFDNKGNYQWVKEADIPVTTSNESLHFQMDHCGNMYVSGTLWFSFPAQLYMFDKAFIKGTVHGPAPFISRFKNTLSPALVKTLTKETPKTCTTSPGPWKLRNFPNPFSKNSNFEYVISYKDVATLQLFNTNGQLVKSFFQNKPHDAGKYILPFNIDLPAGIYIASLTGTETIVTWRIVVLK